MLNLSTEQIGLIISFAIHLLHWLGGRNKATRDAIARVETNAQTQHAEQEARIIRLEETLRHAITKHDLTEIYQRLKSTGETTARVETSIRLMETQLRDLLNEIQRRGLSK